LKNNKDFSDRKDGELKRAELFSVTPGTGYVLPEMMAICLIHEMIADSIIRSLLIYVIEIHITFGLTDEGIQYCE